MVSEVIQPRQVVRVHTDLPFATHDLASPSGETMNGSVACGNLQFVGVDVTGDAAYQGSALCQQQLQVPLG